MDVSLECPYCGEPMDLVVDPTAGSTQSYVEDCAVCCRPMDVFVRCRPGEILSVSISAA